jgi:hypothetical protein
MAKKKALTKREAVRRAIADLGRDAMPLQLQGHIRSKFGIEMSPDHISVEKRKTLLKEAGEGKPAAAAKPAPQGNGEAIDLADIEAVKDLVERVGADSLKKLIDVLAR